MATRDPHEPQVLARQRSEVAVLYWSEFSGWFYRPQSLSDGRRGSSPSRWAQEEIISLAFECGFGAVRLPDGTMIKQAKT